jgi:hypothetical protein
MLGVPTVHITVKNDKHYYMKHKSTSLIKKKVVIYLVGTISPDGTLCIRVQNPSYATVRIHIHTKTWLSTEPSLHLLLRVSPAPQVTMTSEHTRARLVTATILRLSAGVACN